MARKLSLVLGIVFILVGILGFFSNPIIGATGFFAANTLHSIVHLLIGIILVAVSGNEMRSIMWLKIMGVVYLLIMVAGFLSPGGSILGLVTINMADNYLHLVLGVVLLAAGFLSQSHDMPMMAK